MGFKVDNRIEVLYEDNHFIAINKKPGQIVQGDKTGDTPLPELIKLFLKEKYNKPGNVFCGVIHRIDRPVSGVCLFAKTSKALARMNEVFHNRDVQKIYWAVVKNKPVLPEQKLVHYLIKNEKTNKTKAHQNEIKGAKKAELEYKQIISSENYYLLEVYPHTGRHHQIRSQLSAINSPIKGDIKYGFDRTNNDASIHLHARKLIFNHPITGNMITITAPVPDEKLWKYFESEFSNNIRNN